MKYEEIMYYKARGLPIPEEKSKAGEWFAITVISIFFLYLGFLAADSINMKYEEIKTLEAKVIMYDRQINDMSKRQEILIESLKEIEYQNEILIRKIR